MQNRKRIKYSSENLNKAIDAVKSGMPFKTASKLYDIPRSTLQDKVKGRTPLDKKSGPETVLTKGEESLLVEWLLQISARGFPCTKIQLIDSVQILLKELGRPNNFTDGRPGRKWYELFLKRHPELAKRTSQNLTSSRANLTESRIRNWFTEVETYLKETNKFDITFEASRVFNCDESAFHLSPKGDKVLVRKGEKTVYSFVNNDDKECVTTLITCSASGEILPPMVVYNYKRMPKSVVEKFPKHWGIGKSDSGWMTGETFFEYIANIFHPWLVSHSIQFPVILFLDGHTSHLTMALSKFCTNNNIILISLCPNATHILQPLDVAVFRPLKMEWKKTLYKWRTENQGQKITKEVFAPILETTLQKMRNFPDIVKNGFRACGLVPFNVGNIKFHKYFKEEAYEEKSQIIQKDQDKDISNEFLKILESEIPEETLTSFKLSGMAWEGAVEHTSLFKIWKSIRSRSESHEKEIEQTQGWTGLQEGTDIVNTSETDITELINTNNLSFPILLEVPAVDDFLQERTAESEVNEIRDDSSDHRLPLAEINVENNNNHVSETTTHLIRAITPQPKIQGEVHVSPSEKQNVVDIQPSIPTPFKKSLFWPGPKTDHKTNTRKTKDKIPAVATSVQWQQYYKQKEDKKKYEEDQKNKRKEERKRKQTAVENEKKRTKTDSSTVPVSNIKKTNRRRESIEKAQRTARDIFSTKQSNNEASTSKPVEESWYCSLCETDRKLDMRLCLKCLKYFHEECVGLTKDDEDEFVCPNC